MRLLKYLIGGKVAYNHLHPPVVHLPSGYVYKGLKRSLTGNDWWIKYSREVSNVTEQIRVSRSTRSFNLGHNTVEVHWGD